MLARKRPFLAPDFVRAVLKGHSLLGLAFAAAIYLVCLTGTLAVFAHEFQRWENPRAPRLEQVDAEAVNAAFVAAIDRAGPALEHVYITLPTRELPWLSLHTDAGEERAWIADGRGEIVQSGTAPWHEFLTRLHINLHLPRTWGIFIVGLTGVALLSSLISGLLAHPRLFRDAFHLRVGGSPRLQEADLHNRLGVWGLPFHVLVSLTGALLGLTTIIVGVVGLAIFKGDGGKVYELFVPPHPQDDARPAPLMDLRPLFAQIPRLAPGGRVTYVIAEHPREAGASVTLNVADGSQRLSRTDVYAFDRSGKTYFAKRAADNNTGEAIVGAMSQLHFGWFGGASTRVLYGLLGFAMTYLAAGGVLIWLARRRAKGRPAPGWERLWSAVIWGQPLALSAALAAVAVASRAGAAGVTGLPLMAWCGVGLAAIVAARWLQPAATAQVARWGCAGLLLIAAVAHASGLLAGRAVDPMAWTVDAAFVLVAMLLLQGTTAFGRARRVTVDPPARQILQ